MNFVLIALCLFAGWILRVKNILPENAYKSINAWIVYIALPSVALHYIPTITWNTDLLLAVTMPLIVWSGAWIVLTLASRLFHIPAATKTALLLTAGLGNTSFVGFPLTQAYYGNEGFRIAVVCDQLTFIVLSTAGVLTAMHAAHKDTGGIPAGVLVKKIFSFPSFIAFLAALIIPRFADLSFADPLFKTLSGTLVPLALFSVGMQIHFGEWKREIRFLAVGLSYKLLLAPAVMVIAAALFQVTGMVRNVSIFEASMAPMITAAIIATEYNLHPKAANLMVSIGIPLSFVTTAIWWLILGAG